MPFPSSVWKTITSWWNLTSWWTLQMSGLNRHFCTANMGVHHFWKNGWEFVYTVLWHSSKTRKKAAKSFRNKGAQHDCSYQNKSSRHSSVLLSFLLHVQVSISLYNILAFCFKAFPFVCVLQFETEGLQMTQLQNLSQWYFRQYTSGEECWN